MNRRILVTVSDIHITCYFLSVVTGPRVSQTREAREPADRCIVNYHLDYEDGHEFMITCNCNAPADIDSKKGYEEDTTFSLADCN